MDFSSKLLGNAVQELSELPGIGKRTALRLLLHMLKQPKDKVRSMTKAIDTLVNDIKKCSKCFYISDIDFCEICSDISRDANIICVVEDIPDVISIESTLQYRGLYHIIGGRISPIEGISPKDLNIDTLIERVSVDKISEVIFALSSTIEGDTTNFYIYKHLLATGVKLSTIARGVSIGDELQYADEITLGRSITNRIPFIKTID